MIIQIDVFICLTAFYAAYFAKQLLLRRQGIRTDRLAKGIKPRRTRAIETLLPAATYGTAVIQFAGVFFTEYMGAGGPAPPASHCRQCGGGSGCGVLCSGGYHHAG